MTQVASILGALKAALKSHNLLYRDVAGVLGLSEASVKRLFRNQAFDMVQLETICHLMNIEISDLLQLMGERQVQLQQLTEQQEEDIASDLSLLLITVSVLNRWTLDDILNYYDFSQNDCIQWLAHLDRLRIIELLPKNKIKLLVAPNFSWRINGPIQRFFQKTIKQELFDSSYDQDGHKLLVLNGMLSSASNGEFQRKMERLAREFDQLNNADAGLPLSQRHGVTAVFALRDWNYRLFEGFRRR